MRSLLSRFISLFMAVGMALTSLGLPSESKSIERTVENNISAPSLDRAYTVTGGKRTLRIVFSEPVTFGDVKTADCIFAFDPTSGEEVPLSDLPGSFTPIDAQSFGGKEYAMAYDLVFDTDLPQTGALMIVSPGAQASEQIKEIPEIKNIHGTALSIDFTFQEEKNAASALYEIPLLLLGSTVIAPNQVVLFFNYDIDLGVEAPEKYIWADDAQWEGDGTFSLGVKAIDCSIIDGIGCLLTFEKDLPASGTVKLYDPS